jgi:SAM-dependent methyltransferase
MGSQANINNKPTHQFSGMKLWLETPLGKALLQAESEGLEKLLPRRFGYHLLQLGCSDIPMYKDSPIGHKFTISTDELATGYEIFASDEALPLASESIDLVLLHHALDFSDNQHHLLREASRVLIEGGDIIIVGFNPLSSWGLRKQLQWKNTVPWQGQLLTTRRLTDWLKLLEFQVEQINHGLYTLPFNSSAVIRYSSIFDKLATRLNWPTGGIYIISAKKQVLPLTPIQQPWRKLQKSTVAIPVSDNVSRDSQLKVSNKE